MPHHKLLQLLALCHVHLSIFACLVFFPPFSAAYKLSVGTPLDEAVCNRVSVAATNSLCIFLKALTLTMRTWDESHKCASNLPVPLCLVTPLKAEVLAADFGLRGLATLTAASTCRWAGKV